MFYEKVILTVTTGEQYHIYTDEGKVRAQNTNEFTSVSYYVMLNSKNAETIPTVEEIVSRIQSDKFLMVSAKGKRSECTTLLNAAHIVSATLD